MVNIKTVNSGKLWHKPYIRWWSNKIVKHCRFVFGMNILWFKHKKFFKYMVLLFVEKGEMKVSARLKNLFYFSFGGRLKTHEKFQGIGKNPHEQHIIIAPFCTLFSTDYWLCSDQPWHPVTPFELPLWKCLSNINQDFCEITFVIHNKMILFTAHKAKIERWKDSQDKGPSWLMK